MLAVFGVVAAGVSLRREDAHVSERRVVFSVCTTSAGNYSASVLTRGAGGFVEVVTNGRTGGSLSELPLRKGLNTVAFPGDQVLSVDVPGAVPCDVRGGALPFTTVQAEDAVCHGAVIGPDYDSYTDVAHLAAEASGRKACVLKSSGDYVEFTVPVDFNAFSARCSVPDAAAGGGINTSVAVSVAGAAAGDLPLTSAYSWYYGDFPYNNDPSSGHPHHFYDESRRLLGADHKAGTKLRLSLPPGSTVAVTVDLVDFFDAAPPHAPPAGAVSIADFGADPTGANDSYAAVTAAVTAAGKSGAAVWMPAGNYTVAGIVHLPDGVSVHGAGHWHTVLRGTGEQVGQGAIGFYSKWSKQGGSAGIGLYDFAIVGDVRSRCNACQVNGVGGAPVHGSTIQGLWIQHTKVGLWLAGPGDDLLVTGVLVRDTTADGVNLCDGWSDSTVTQSSFRNTGDDGIALFSSKNADRRINVTHNTMQVPVLANNMAVYGGHDNTVVGNVFEDTIQRGGGMHAGNRFQAVPISGVTLFHQNTVRRCGCLNMNWKFGIGAVWFYGLDSAMNGTVKVTDTLIEDSPREAVQFIGEGVTGVSLSRVSVERTGTFVLQVQCDGEAHFDAVTATGVGSYPVYDCGSNFTIVGAGDTGWLPRCGQGCSNGTQCQPGGYCAHCGFQFH